MNTTDQKDSSKERLGQIFPIQSVDLDDLKTKAIFKKKFASEIDWFFLCSIATQRDLHSVNITRENVVDVLSSSIQSDEHIDMALRTLVEETYKAWLGFLAYRLEKDKASADQKGVQFIQLLFRLIRMRLEPTRPKGMESKSKNDPSRFLIRERMEQIELSLKNTILDVRKEPWVPLGVLDALEKSNFLLRAAQTYWSEVMSFHTNRGKAEADLFLELVQLTDKTIASTVFDAVIADILLLNLPVSNDAVHWRTRIGNIEG